METPTATLYDSRGGGLVSYDEHTRTLPGRGRLRASRTSSVRDVTFRNNHAEGRRCALRVRDEPALVRARALRDNDADYGGALVLRVDIDARFVDSSFVGNRSTWQGGAVYLD
jgi:hypothetical protein